MSSNNDRGVAQQLGTQRPGAMTAVMLAARPTATGPRELRVGRVEGGAITDDRQYRTALTYGRSEKASIMIGGAEKGCAPLFERSAAGVFTLVVPPGARGRLALTAGMVDLAQIAGTSIPLDASARGKLVIGGTTLLFQMVPAASVPLRPRLTSAARGGLLTMIDWRFTSYVMASLCAHVFFVAWLDSADFALETDARMIPDQLAQLILEMPDPPPVPDVEDPDAVQPTVEDGVASNVPAQPTHAQPARPARDHAGPAMPATSAAEQARMAAELADQAGQILVGGLGSGDSAMQDLLRGAVVANAQEIFDTVRGVGIASGPAGVLHSRAGGGNGSGETGTLGDLVARGVGATEQRREGPALHEVRVIYTFSEPEDPIQRSGDRDPDDVVSMLRARRQAFTACYEQRTRVNPDLQGKIGVMFTISEMGTVSGVHITENRTDDATLGLCIASTFQRIRFGEVEGSGDSTFAHSFIFAPQR